MSERDLQKTEGTAFTHDPRGKDRGAHSDARMDSLTDGLRSLAVPAPADTFTRFRRRAAVVQGTRMLFESQVIGFWVVLDALLRLLLGSHAAGSKDTVTKSAIQKSAVQKSAVQGEGV